MTLGAALLALALAGCASHRPQIADVERRLADGEPEAALERLEAASFADRDAGLYQLHRGMVLRLAGDRVGSIEAFERALDILGELEAVSLSETAGSLVVSEGVRSYSGAIYERILVHVFQALNHLERGDYNAARVEARRIDLGLRRIDNELGRAPHGGDAFARYLSGLIFEAAGERDDARIAYRKAWQAYRDRDAKRPNLAAPSHLGERLARLAGQAGVDPDVEGLPETPDEPAAERGRGELFVIVHDGLVPARISSSIWVQTAPNGELFRLSVPALRARGATGSPIEIRVTQPGAVAATDNPVPAPLVEAGLVALAENRDPAAAPIARTGESVLTETVADVAATAQATLSDQVSALTTRSVARNVVRHQITREAREESPFLGLLVNLFGVLLEEADTRSWRTLPATIRMARLSLEPGTYEIGLDAGALSGAILPALDPVTLEAGDMVFRSVHRLPRDTAPVRGLER